MIFYFIYRVHRYIIPAILIWNFCHSVHPSKADVLKSVKKNPTIYINIIINTKPASETTEKKASLSNSHNQHAQRRNHHVSSPGIYLLSSGLLQLYAVDGMSDGLLWKSSPFRTPPHVWSQELDDATVSHRCCIGCLSVNELSTRLHAWYTSLWLVRHPHT